MGSQGVDVRLVVPGGTPAGSPTPAVAVPGSAPEPSLPALPRTGAEVLAALLLAVALVALGALLVKAGRARRPA